MADFILRPIGTVRSPVTELQRAGFDWQAVTSEIVLDGDLAGALAGLAGFSHIVVLFWMDRAKRTDLAPLVHPRGDPRLPLVGFLATRSPNRPNPVGLTTARIVDINNNIIRVRGLDAIDGTPVIDIKPFIPAHDCLEGARAAAWAAAH
ncbi:MAG: tRNA (N6-threonylcarbamoyladenosine(37)-N6)-methyltransferase TrmO [Chloroflexi bacterium]|nr:tRNA (N6-threonylcarbamoyladenosine(37)-N6)-methyltransferase TrmO [Chloroflexota bacterium]